MAKHCADCVHSFKSETYDELRCDRYDDYCFDSRMKDTAGHCGLEGRGFSLKPSLREKSEPKENKFMIEITDEDLRVLENNPEKANPSFWIPKLIQEIYRLRLIHGVWKLRKSMGE